MTTPHLLLTHCVTLGHSEEVDVCLQQKLLEIFQPKIVNFKFAAHQFQFFLIQAAVLLGSPSSVDWRLDSHQMRAKQAPALLLLL